MTTLYTNKGRDQHVYDPADLPTTSQGNGRQAQTLVGCTKATLVDGDLTWEAAHGGSWANKINVDHVTGETGPLDRPLSVVCDLEAETVTVTWRTDGAGNPVAPTPAEVVTEAAGVQDLDKLVTPIDGGATACTVLNQKLAGGLDDGDWLRINGLPYLHCINTKV